MGVHEVDHKGKLLLCTDGGLWGARGRSRSPKHWQQGQQGGSTVSCPFRERLVTRGCASVLNCPVDLSQWPLMFILMTLYHLRVSDPILWIRQLRLRETGSDPAGPQCRQWQDSEFPPPPQPLRVSVLE